MMSIGLRVRFKGLYKGTRALRSLRGSLGSSKGSLKGYLRGLVSEPEELEPDGGLGYITVSCKEPSGTVPAILSAFLVAVFQTRVLPT